MEQLMLNSIGERLKYLRNIKNKTQKEMSEILGVTLGMYQKYESNKSNISVNTSILLKKTFNINIDWLITGDSDMLPLDNILEEYFGDVKYGYNHNIVTFEAIYNRLSFACYFINKKDTNILSTLSLLDKKEIFYNELGLPFNKEIESHNKLYNAKTKQQRYSKSFIAHENIPYTKIIRFAINNWISLEWLLTGKINKNINYIPNEIYFTKVHGVENFDII